MATPNQGEPNPQDNQVDNNKNGPAEVIEDRDGPNINIPILYIPDLHNSILSEAIRDGMRVGTTNNQYIIHTPLLKDHIGIDQLKVTLPSENLETCSNPPVSFVTNCQATPFQDGLLVGALKTFKTENLSLQFIPWR